MEPKDHYHQLLTEASECHQRGDLHQAINLYNRLTTEFPGEAEPIHRLALIALAKGSLQESLPLLQKAIQLNPNDPIYHVNYGEALYRSGQIEKAQMAFENSRKINPDFTEATKKLTKVFRKKGDFDSAIRINEELKVRQPGNTEVAFQLGTIYLETGQLTNAEKSLSECLRQKPDHAKALNNLGIIYQEREQWDQAISCYLKASEADPKLRDSAKNLALIYQKIGYYEKSKITLTELAKSTGDPLLEWSSELITPDIFDSEAHIQTFRRSLETLISKKKGIPKIQVGDLTDCAIQPPSILIYNGMDDKDFKVRYAELFNGIPQVKLPGNKNQKPNIGFVVTHGHEGVFMKCMRGIIEHISKEKFDVTIVCSFPTGASVLQTKIKNSGVNFLQLPKDFEQAVRIVAAQNFDFLHFWEVGTDAVNYFLPFFRTARFQAASWGWPTTSGIPQMDFFISSEHLDEPTFQANYSEQLVRFRKIPTYYYRPALPEKFTSRKEIGLPEGRVYLCIQNIRKIQPSFDSIVLEILQRDQEGTVVMLGDKMPAITEALAKRLKTSLGEDLMQRVRILPRLDSGSYFSAIRHADVILDTTCYTGGGNTTYDCFALGACVVTLEGDLHRARFTSAAYRQIGITDLITKDTESFIIKCLEVAQNPHLRKDIGARILENSHKVFEDMEAVRELENFMLQITGKTASENPDEDWQTVRSGVSGLINAGSIKEALSTCVQYVNDHRDHLDSRLLMASILFDIKDIKGFQTVIDQCLKNFKTADSLSNIADFISKYNFHKEAISIYQQSLDLDPDHFGSLTNLGGQYLEKKEFLKAIEYSEKATQVKNDFFGTYLNLGLAYENLDRMVEAKRSLIRASELAKNPFIQLHAETLVPNVFHSKGEIDSFYQGLTETLQNFSIPQEPVTPGQLVQGFATPTFNLNFLGRDEAPIRVLWGQLYDKVIQPFRCEWTNAKPKIGFLVTMNHVGIFNKAMGGILDHMDMDKYDYYIFCHAGSSNLKLSERFSHKKINIVPMAPDLEHMLSTIHKYQIDLLYHWEHGSDTMNYFVPFYKPAKRQMLSWGSTFTSGTERMDCYLSSKLLETETSIKRYSEPYVHLLSTLPTYYYPQASGKTFRKEDFKLPADKFWYVCPQNLLKIHPDFDAFLLGVMKGAKDAILVFLDDQKIAPILQRRFSKTLNEIEDQVYFIPKMEHQDYSGFLSVSDVSLDPPYFSGTNTSFDCLEVSLPVVAFPGDSQKALYTKAMYDIMGIDGLVAQSKEEYIEIARRLYSDASFLAGKKKEITSRKDILFQNETVVKEFEDLIEKLLEQG